MNHHAFGIPLRLSGIGLAVFLLAAAPGAVAATTNGPIAATGGMTATLPLLGTPLTVAVTLDDQGNVLGVALDPSTALSKTKSGDDFVKFTNTDGTVKVSIRARAGQLAIKARARQLSDLLGPGTWSADVFGTDATSAVAYTVGKDPSGKPTVAFGTAQPAAGITWKAGPIPVLKMSPDTDKAGKARGTRAVASGTFAWQGFTKTLTIMVNVAADGSAGLLLSLSGRDVQKLSGTLASLAGSRTWSARLCDGTAVRVTYHVDPTTGKAVFDGASGAKATEKSLGHGFFAWFDRSRTAVFATLVQANGTYSLDVYGRSGQCGGQRIPFGGGQRHLGSGHGGTGTVDLSSTSKPH